MLMLFLYKFVQVPSLATDLNWSECTRDFRHTFSITLLAYKTSILRWTMKNANWSELGHTKKTYWIKSQICKFCNFLRGINTKKLQIKIEVFTIFLFDLTSLVVCQKTCTIIYFWIIFLDITHLRLQEANLINISQIFISYDSVWNKALLRGMRSEKNNSAHYKAEHIIIAHFIFRYCI